MTAGTVLAAADNETTRLLASDAAPGKTFGQVVAISGTIALVGNPTDDPNGPSSGSVYVFDLSAPSFPVELTKMLPSDAATWDRFGGSLAVSGTLAIVGAPWSGTNDAGAAYVFDLSDPSAPVQVVKLVASDATASTYFGGSVAIHGTTVVVGCTGDDTSGLNAGSAYIFDISDPTSPVETKLLASDGSKTDLFGTTVAVHGDLALVGAPWDDDLDSFAGSAYLFDISDPSSPVETKLIGSHVSSSDQFGASIVLEGTVALIGAPYQGASQDARGAVYIYDVASPSAPVELTELAAFDGEHLDSFGDSVAIDGDAVLIGAWRDEDIGNSTGSAYAFDISDPLAPVVTKLLPSGGEKPSGAHQEFGVSVAIDGGTMLVGAPLYGAFADKDMGATYIFTGVFETQFPCASSYCTWWSGSPHNQARMSVSHCDLAGPAITVELSDAPVAQFCYLLIGDGGGTITDPPGAQGDLCLGGGTLLSRYTLDVGTITISGTYSTNIRSSLSGGPGYGIPSSGGQAIQPGDSWNFQYWHRRPAGQLAGFSEALRVTFD